MVEENLVAERKKYKLEIARIQLDFGQENKSLDGTILA